MRTRVKGRCQLKLTTLGAAKVCFLKENEIARVCEAHFCSVGGIMAKERLRRGYTTGSCAAAAAGAAAGITKTALLLIGGFLGTDYTRSKLYDPSFTTEFRKGREA